MTFYEACSRALELEGISDQERKERFLFAFSNVPDAPVNKQLKLNPGQSEEDFIEQIREIHREIQALSNDQKRMLQVALEARGQDRMKNN